MFIMKQKNYDNDDCPTHTFILIRCGIKQNFFANLIKQGVKMLYALSSLHHGMETRHETVIQVRNANAIRVRPREVDGPCRFSYEYKLQTSSPTTKTHSLRGAKKLHHTTRRMNNFTIKTQRSTNDIA